MKFLLLLVFAVFGMFACTSATVCSDLEAPVIDYVATNVVMSLCTCTSATQVESYVTSEIPSSVQSVICPSSSAKKPVKGTKLGSAVGTAICGPVINAVVGLGCTQIPSCSGPNPSSDAINAVITKCQGAI